MFRVAAALALVLIWLVLLVQVVKAEAPPPRPEQPRPDIFSCGAVACDKYNPVTQKAKNFRLIAYRVVVESGCTAGTIPSDLQKMNGAIMSVRGQDGGLIAFTISRNDAAYDFTVHINCGAEQIRICGSVNTYCLGRGYPYNADVDISDILSTYYEASRISILLHEILGHAISSWNEQYALCAASCGFQPTANWRDFMNTGPDSRHGIEQIETERLWRTMPELFPPACTSDPCWDGTFWRFQSGWKVNPATDEWYDPQNRLYWKAREPWGGRCYALYPICDHAGATTYDQSLGDPWLVVP